MKRTLFVLFVVLGFLTIALPARATGTGPWDISETNGCCSVRAGDGDVGDIAYEETQNLTDFTWNVTGSTYNGDDVGTWKTPNGNELATDSNCNNVLIVSAGSNGTDWTLHFVNNRMLIINRRCDLVANGGSGNSTMALSGLSQLGHSFFVCGGTFDCSGTYQAMTVTASIKGGG